MVGIKSTVVFITLWIAMVALHNSWNGIKKLWWVHIETLISLLKGYQFTGDRKCLEWFEKVHDYTWAHFKIPNIQNGTAI